MLMTQEQRMSSREIADLTGKPHADLMKAIRAMEDAWVNVGQGNFSLAKYTDEQGKQRPMYNLSKTECLYIATKFNDDARARLIIRWEALERNNVPALPMAEIKELISLKFAELIESNAKQSADIADLRKLILSQRGMIEMPQDEQSKKYQHWFSNWNKLQNDKQ